MLKQGYYHWDKHGTHSQQGKKGECVGE